MESGIWMNPSIEGEGEEGNGGQVPLTRNGCHHGTGNDNGCANGPQHNPKPHYYGSAVDFSEKRFVAPEINFRVDDSGCGEGGGVGNNCVHGGGHDNGCTHGSD
jgi:hypothetical protein